MENRCKKVAFLICSDTIGGHEYQSIELVKSAKKYCIPTIIFNSTSQLSLLNGENINYLVAERPFFRGGNFLLQFLFGIANFFRIRGILKEYSQIVVCAGTIEAGISTGLALMGGNIILYVPAFVDRTWLWGNVGHLYNFISRGFIIFYKSLITINRFQALAFLKLKKVYIFPNIIRIEKSTSVVNTCNRKIYFVGRLEKGKRILELIKWLDHPNNPFTEFLIIGDGSEKKNIESMIPDLKCLKVKLNGWVNKFDQELLLSEHDVLVFNSLYEGDPLVIREANERGSLVVVRNILGIRGCTNKKNRFNNQSELLTILNLAYSRKLRLYKNQSPLEIDKIRDNVAKEIFV